MSEQESPAEMNSEEQIVARAKEAITRCNWTLGECAAAWTRKYSKGRTDAAFAELVGLSPEQVYQRRRVYETFGDVKHNCPKLSWSHYYVALTWDDAADCLGWADDMEATVAEMRAWRRAQHGEDLSEPAEVAEQSSEAGSDMYSELPDEASDREIGGREATEAVEQSSEAGSNTYSESKDAKLAPQTSVPKELPEADKSFSGGGGAVPLEAHAADYRGIARQAVQSLGLIIRMLTKDWANLLASEQAVICDEVEKLVAVVSPQGEADVSMIRKRLDWMVSTVTKSQWARWGESDRLFLAGPIEDLHQVVRVKAKKKSEERGEEEH